jgi:hypothetical protein
VNDLKRKRRAKQKKREHNKSKLGVRGRDPLHIRRAQDAMHAGSRKITAKRASCLLKKSVLNLSGKKLLNGEDAFMGFTIEK